MCSYVSPSGKRKTQCGLLNHRKINSSPPQRYHKRRSLCATGRMFSVEHCLCFHSHLRPANKPVSSSEIDRKGCRAFAFIPSNSYAPFYGQKTEHVSPNYIYGIYSPWCKRTMRTYTNGVKSDGNASGADVANAKINSSLSAEAWRYHKSALPVVSVCVYGIGFNCIVSCCCCAAPRSCS